MLRMIARTKLQACEDPWPQRFHRKSESHSHPITNLSRSQMLPSHPRHTTLREIVKVGFTGQSTKAETEGKGAAAVMRTAAQENPRPVRQSICRIQLHQFCICQTQMGTKMTRNPRGVNMCELSWGRRCEQTSTHSERPPTTGQRKVFLMSLV